MPVRNAEEGRAGQRAFEFAQSGSSSAAARAAGQLRLTLLSPTPSQLLAGCFACLERQHQSPPAPAKPWLPASPPFATSSPPTPKTLATSASTSAPVNRYATGDNYIRRAHGTASSDLDPLAPIPKMGEKVQLALAGGSLLAIAPANPTVTGCHSRAQAEAVQQPKDYITFRRIVQAAELLGLLTGPLSGTLRDYQVFGADWLGAKFSSGHGAILADEMGLGKTPAGRWLSCVGLHGGGGEAASAARIASRAGVHRDKPRGNACGRELRREDWTLLLSTYEVARLVLLGGLQRRKKFFRLNFHSTPLVVDEGHRLKNSNSPQLHLALRPQCQLGRLHPDRHRPIQNNLDELFHLLSFVAPKVFRLKLKDQFIAEVTDFDSGALYEILKPFLLRRIKEDVLKSLPKKVETLSTLQPATRPRLLNIQMQLRKCINHPYLFDGVEPEPFQPGEHLVTASAKLILIDRLLKYLKANGTRLHVRTLDGSVRGEERFLATFVFLLSTRAGGVGLNLVSADTVIFVDSDFNPQNDLQAAARVHRIGQTRCTEREDNPAGRQEHHRGDHPAARGRPSWPSLSRSSGNGKFALGFDDADKAKEADASKQLMDDIEDADASSREVAGRSLQSNAAASATSAAAAEEEAAAAHMYMWEGKDYSSGAADIDQLEAKDETVLQALLTDLRVKERRQRRVLDGGCGDRASGALTQLPDAASSRRQARRPLTEAEKAERRAKREAAARPAPPRRRRRPDAGRSAVRRSGAQPATRRIRLPWQRTAATKRRPTMNREASATSAKTTVSGLNYVIGDVAEPQEGLEAGAAIVCQSVDDAGRWGSGGVFAALDAAWREVGRRPAGRLRSGQPVGRPRLGDLHLLRASGTVPRSTAGLSLACAPGEPPLMHTQQY
uniref:Helicase n=1 Tax=Macrostomum lignano TaxID=282301 RepID=A0A1I8JS02_9PLAT